MADQKVDHIKSMYQKCHEILINNSSDVHFVFDCDDKVIKIPANKRVLSAGSAVFDAMFNGPLNEEGDVKIVDVSPAAFQQFLNFFYESQVELTMDHIAEVLKLIDKYDVADCFPACVKFLKDTVSIDDVFWGFYLAIKFNLEDLKEYFTDMITENYKIVFDKIKLDNGKLSSSLSNRLTEIECEMICPYILAISKNVVFHMSNKIGNFQQRTFFDIALSKDSRHPETIQSTQTIIFSLDKSMLLVDIFISSIYQYNHSYWSRKCFNNFYISIEEKEHLFGWDANKIYRTDITLKGSVNNFKLPSPIVIKPNYFYAIIFRTDSGNFQTDQSCIPETSIPLAPNVNISFPQTKGQYKYSLVRQLFFTHTIDN